MFRTQKGMTFTGVLVVVVMIVAMALTAMKLIPTYIRHSSIKTVMRNFKEEPGVTKMHPKKIKQMALNRLDINSVYDFDPKTLEVKREKKYIVLSTDYEVRKNMVANIDVVVKFSERVEIPIL